MHESNGLIPLRNLAIDSKLVPKGSIVPPVSAFRNPPKPKTKTLLLPFNLDAEFQDNLGKTTPFSSEEIGERIGVTVQIRGVRESEGLIFAHPNLLELPESKNRTPRHPVVSYPCVVGDWLDARGVGVEIFEDLDEWTATKRTCRLQPFAHFAVADIGFLAGTPAFANLLRDLYVKRKLRQTRRLMAHASGHKDSKCGVVTLKPWVIRLEGIPFRMSLEIIDSNAVHGVAGYRTLAANVGFPLEAKDAFSREGANSEITRMGEMYFARSEDFDAYALGDCYVSDILEKNETLWKHIWQTLGIEEFFPGSRLTIGSSVAGIVKARIAKTLGFHDPNDETLEGLTTGTHNAGFLGRFAKEKNPICLLSKVDGGRCRNANPLQSELSGVLCDIDISGAYASAMSSVPLVFGKVRTHGFGNAKDMRADLKECPSVAEMLRRHEHRMEPRTWFWRVNTREPYSFETDVIPSWIDWRHIAQRKSDSESQGLDVLQDADSGEMRYFSREVWNGTLTSDLLDVIQATFSQRQYDEWSQKTVVRAVAYVDKKDRLSIEEFRERLANLPEYAWTSLTLGELVSDSARANRMEHPKKSPLNELYKLLSNTTYGVSVSRHFATSSTIAGSNVTACVRAFMVLAEKGLNLAGSITDGHLYDLNRVLHRREPSRKPADSALSTRAYRLSLGELARDGRAKFGPLIGSHISARWNEGKLDLTIEHEDGTAETLSGKQAETRINEAAFHHLQTLWPNCRLLTEETRVVTGLCEDGSVKYQTQTGLFRFEMKSFFQRAVLHASANYRLDSFDPSKPPAIKMRSFESRRYHWGFTVDDSGELIERDTYSLENPPASRLMESLKTPHAVTLLPPFCKTRILLPGIFQTQRKFSSESCMVSPGDSIYVLGRPHLVSLTAFTFQNRHQYERWKHSHSRLTNKYGVSFELWFLNPDGETVDYAGMIRGIDAAVCSGVNDPVTHFDSLRKRGSSETVNRFHTAKKAMKTHLAGRLASMDEDDLPIIHEDRQEGYSGREWE